MLDDAINIRAVKRYACDHQDSDYEPTRFEPTGKTVAVVGAGPAGLTVAYYLTLMGHKVTIYEQRKAMGGMMRYGIPNYRFDKDLLEEECQWIIKQGIELHLGVRIGEDISIEELRAKYDALFIGIGAHSDRKLGLEGEDSAQWVLVDFGEVVVHVFRPEIRDYYRLETLWGDAPVVDLSE